MQRHDCRRSIQYRAGIAAVAYRLGIEGRIVRFDNGKLLGFSLRASVMRPVCRYGKDQSNPERVTRRQPASVCARWRPKRGLRQWRSSHKPSLVKMWRGHMQGVRGESGANLGIVLRCIQRPAGPKLRIIVGMDDVVRDTRMSRLLLQDDRFENLSRLSSDSHKFCHWAMHSRSKTGHKRWQLRCPADTGCAATQWQSRTVWRGCCDFPEPAF